MSLGSSREIKLHPPQFSSVMPALGRHPGREGMDTGFRRYDIFCIAPIVAARLFGEGRHELSAN
jgi:hypothetical protein